MGYKVNVNTKKDKPSSIHKRQCLNGVVLHLKKGDIRICPHDKVQFVDHYEYRWQDLHWWRHPIIFARALQVMATSDEKEDPDAETR